MSNYVAIIGPQEGPFSICASPDPEADLARMRRDSSEPINILTKASSVRAEAVQFEMQSELTVWRMAGDKFDCGLPLLEETMQRAVAKHQAPEHVETFVMAYKSNRWKGADSISGPSSGMDRTATLRAALPEIVRRHSVRTFLDAPCGDFFWMKSVIPNWDVNYIGGDVVPELIASNSKKHSAQAVEFRVVDLTRDELPSADVLFCRDCLFHLSYADIARVFDNFLKSNIRLLMTTSHIADENFQNTDIKTGNWRRFDLVKAPFNLISEPRESVLDGGGDRYMFLWDRDQIEVSLRRFINAHLAD